jgi:predicted Zn-dependent protease
MKRRILLAFVGMCLTGACSGAVHQLPTIDRTSLALAQAEVRGLGQPPRHDVSDGEARAILKAATARIFMPAYLLCGEMRVGECGWKFRLSPDRSMNAGAGPNGYIVVNRGVVEYAANEEEVSVVIAHEIGHQIANHVEAGMRNQMVGAMIGATVLGVAGALATARSNDRERVAVVRDAVTLGGQVGGAIGRLSFSKEQEREADYLAALILYRAGIDLDKARGLMVTLARTDGASETGLLDSHPAGPDRLAGWDRAVAEIRASGGRLPPRN